MSVPEIGVQRFSFQYTIKYHEFKTQMRPLLVVSLTLDVPDPPGPYDIPVLVDTGADSILLPDDVREMLQIEESDCREEWGETLSGPARVLERDDVRLTFPELGDVSFVTTVGFAMWRSSPGYGLLGRDVFDHLRFCFTHRQDYEFYVGYP